MRTRRSPKNQERLWRALAGPRATVVKRSAREITVNHPSDCACENCHAVRREDEMRARMRGFYMHCQSEKNDCYGMRNCFCDCDGCLEADGALNEIEPPADSIRIEGG